MYCFKNWQRQMSTLPFPTELYHWVIKQQMKKSIFLWKHSISQMKKYQNSSISILESLINSLIRHQTAVAAKITKKVRTRHYVPPDRGQTTSTPRKHSCPKKKKTKKKSELDQVFRSNSNVEEIQRMSENYANSIIQIMESGCFYKI